MVGCIVIAGSVFEGVGGEPRVGDGKGRENEVRTGIVRDSGGTGKRGPIDSEVG